MYYVFYDSGISQRIDTVLVSKIDTFLREGVTDTREMKRLLKIIVNPLMSGGNKKVTHTLMFKCVRLFYYHEALRS